jgi:hypothetical protein
MHFNVAGAVPPVNGNAKAEKPRRYSWVSQVRSGKVENGNFTGAIAHHPVRQWIAKFWLRQYSTALRWSAY